MIEKLEKIEKIAIEEILNTKDLKELDIVSHKYLGKKGELTSVLRGIADLSIEEKRNIGEKANIIKGQIAKQVELKKEEIIAKENIVEEDFDTSLPGEKFNFGGLHPTIQMMYDLNDAFASMGFEIYEGKEISSDREVFDNLNFPKNHPARETMDTYWIKGTEKEDADHKYCLRPHLTGDSVKYLLEKNGSARVIYPGIVYRNESTDPRHERMFMQYEALIIEKDFPFASGKILIDAILEKVFGKKVETRMRAGFFPFVEPGFEIDMQCQMCEGKGCRVCNNAGWIEIMPGGSPHPNVLKAAGIDSDIYSGFYINIGIDRLVMMKNKIDDIRHIYSGDIRFLEQFK